VGRPLEAGEVSAFWFRQGLAAIRTRPRDYLALEARKLRRIIDPVEDDAFGDDYGAYAERSAVLRHAPVTLGAVVPLAIVGALLVTLRRSLAAWCVAFAGAYVLSLLVFFVTPRYRLPLAPPALVCAAVTLAWLGDLVARRHVLGAAAAAGLVLAAALLLPTPRADLARLAAMLTCGALAGALAPGRPAQPAT
jgi:hypothetical protein